MSQQALFSLYQLAHKEAMKLFLINPKLLEKMPVMLRRELARECVDALTSFFKRVKREENRKIFSKSRFTAIVNDKEFDLIPQKFKNMKIVAYKKTLDNLQARELAKFAAYIK